MGMLLWGIVPGYKVQIMINGGVPELLSVADDSVEVAFWRRYEI